MALGYLSDDLREDEEIVMEAIRQNPAALDYAGEKLYYNIEFVAKVLREVPEIEEFMDDELKSYPEIQETLEYKFHKENNRDDTTYGYKRGMDEEIEHLRSTFESLRPKNNEENLQFLDEDSKGTRESVLEVIRNDWLGNSLQYASEELREDREILEAIKRTHDAYTIASEIQPTRSEVDGVMQEIVSEKGKNSVQATKEDEEEQK